VVVVLENRIYVYNFEDLKLIDAIDTCFNPKGICALSSEPSRTVLACPHKQKGHVQLIIFEKNHNMTIEAHQNNVSCISLNQQGTLVATASDKGTLIRIFSTENASVLQEVRRGADKAEIYSISFNKASTWIASSSDKGTIHIFAIIRAATMIARPDVYKKELEQLGVEEKMQMQKSKLDKSEMEVKNPKHT